MNNNFEQIVMNNKEEIIKTLQELIQIKSVYDESTKTALTPFGKGINDALKYMEKKAKEDGFEVLNDNGYALEISYGEGEKNVGVLCHLDVVPEGKNWMYPPYEARIVDNKIYGRGSTDDKGPLIASYFALKFIKDANIKLKNKIKLILGTDEETAWRGIHHYLKSHPLPDLGFSPDCSFPLVYGEKGRMAIDLKIKDVNKCAVSTDALISLKGGERYNVVIDEATAIARINVVDEFMKYLKENHLEGDVTEKDSKYEYFLKGTAAHAMEPEKGINAGTHLCNFFKNYTSNQLVKYVAENHHLDFNLNNMGLSYTDYEMGPITCNIGIIDINPDNTRVTLDIRYPERYDVENFKKVYANILSKYNLEITNFEHKVPHYVSPNSELVKALYEAYVKNTNDSAHKPFTVGGGTYASILENGVAYGMGFPYEEELAHQPNEFLDIDSLLKGILIYIDAILATGDMDA